MKYVLPIDHLPVGPMIYDFAAVYKMNGYTAGGLSYSDFNHWATNTGHTWDSYQLLLVGGKKFICSLSTRNHYLRPVTETHGIQLNGFTNIYPSINFPRVTNANYVLSFKIKVLEDYVDFGINRAVFMVDPFSKSILYYSDFGNFKTNDEFDIKLIGKNKALKTFINGRLISDIPSDISNIDNPLFVMSDRQRSYSVQGLTPSIVIRDVILTTDDDSSDYVNAISTVPLNSTTHSEMTVPYLTTDIEPFNDMVTVFPDGIKETLLFECMLDADIVEIGLTASVMVDVPTNNPIRYWLKQNDVVITEVGVVYPRVVLRPGRVFPTVKITKPYDHTANVTLVMVIFDD